MSNILEIPSRMRAAAKLLRDIAEGASGVPWRASGNNLDGPAGPVAIAYQCFADAIWMALTDPALAKPLASLLEDIADIWRQQVDESGLHQECGGRVDDDGPDRCWCFEHAIGVAQHVLVRAGQIAART